MSTNDLLHTNNVPGEENAPNESYRFQFTPEELKGVQKIHNASNKKFFIGIITVIIYLILWFCPIRTWHLIDGLMLGISIGAIIVFTLFSFLVVRNNNRAFKNTEKIRCSTIYEYLIFDQYLRINLYRNNEQVRSSKCYFNEIQCIQDMKNLLEITIGGQGYLLRKCELQEDSYFYTFMRQKPKKTIKRNTVSIWITLALLFLWFSFLCLMIATRLMRLASADDKLAFDYTWIFFSMVLIAIASIVFSIISYVKEKNGKGLIFFGCIPVLLLCAYSAFAVINGNGYSHSPALFLRAEQLADIDFPEYQKIYTLDWSEKDQDPENGYIHHTGYVYFNDEERDVLVKQFADDPRWMTDVPHSLRTISTEYGDDLYFDSDYSLFINADTGEFNTPPKESGTYHFYQLLYIDYPSIKPHLEIIEYDIDYVK